jgi:hypothetical protein
MRVPGIIGATNQTLKAVAAFGMLISGVAVPWIAARLGASDDAVLSLQLGGVLLSAAGLVLGCWGIRCPSCKA